MAEVLGWDGVKYDNDSQGKTISSQGTETGGETTTDTGSGSNNVQFGVIRLYR